MGVINLDLINVAQSVDDEIEYCARRGFDLNGTIDHVLEHICKSLPFDSAYLNSNLFTTDPFFKSTSNKQPPDQLNEFVADMDDPEAVSIDSTIWYAQPLDFDGRTIGHLALEAPPESFSRDHEALNYVFAVAEQLDDVLWNFYRSRTKQQLIEAVTEALCDPMFSQAMDKTAELLSNQLDFNDIIVFYRIATAPQTQTVHYRQYRESTCEHNSVNKPNHDIDQMIERHGTDLIQGDEPELGQLLDGNHILEQDFSFGMIDTDTLGTIVVSFDDPPGNLEQDLFRFIARTINQRLIDFYREWRSLAKFFSSDVIHELLSETEYEKQFLTPQEHTTAILYADITSFTQLCENNVDQPGVLSEFVDDWGHHVVEEIWDHGGTFDKMVGDCVIALFSPPFYERAPHELVDSALQTARSIHSISKEMLNHPALEQIDDEEFPGLGVAIGINLCKVTCGLYGPDEDFTAFGSGMNETARLQSLAEFQETLVMDRAVEAVQSRHPDEFNFEGPFESDVKNVDEPLRYFRDG